MAIHYAGSPAATINYDSEMSSPGGKNSEVPKVVALVSD